jgi:hypothetical protein
MTDKWQHEHDMQAIRALMALITIPCLRQPVEDLIDESKRT